MKEELEQLKLELRKASDKLDRIWEEDLKNDVPYTQHCENTRAGLNEYYDVYGKYSTLGTVEDYELKEMDKLAKECRMTISEFENACKQGFFTNDDGSGYYATEDHVSELYAFPKLFARGKVNRNFGFVVWYNK